MLSNESDKRTAHRAVVARALDAVSAMNLQAFLDCTHEDLIMEVPFDPDFAPADKTGLRRLTEKSFRKFKSLDIQVQRVHDLTDPDCLIAEYTSNGLSAIGDVNYANRYISVFQFAEGLIHRWCEYTSPLVWREAKAKMDAARAVQQQGATA
jgi:ketosteroid isomerase-like protein